MKERIRRLSPRTRWLLAGGAMMIAAASLAFTQISNKESGRHPAKVVVDNTPLKREAAAAVPSFAPVVKKVAPSVVKIYTTSRIKVRMDGGFPFEDPFFRQFFGNPFGNDDGRPRFRSEEQHALGSGVIVSADGYILTNNHVVDGAQQIKVALPTDNREYTAKVVGTDPKTDIALLKINATGLRPLPMGDSDQVQVGDLVLAVGNPYGIGETVTMGIVSAKGRTNLNIEDYEDFIQTDAAINPGNSGGALVDVEGRLIGINTAILSQTGGNHGIGFAVPVNLARHVMDSLIEYGKVERGFMGVSIQDLTPELAKEFGDAHAHGALVGDVTAGSPAAKAGIKQGDVIVGFNGKPARDSRHLRLEVAETAPGKRVKVKLLRDGKAKEVELTLAQMPGTALASNSPPANGDQGEHLNGVTVGDLDASARAQLNAPAYLKGAVVTQIDPDCAAYQSGLREGDVIEEINHRRVTSADDAVNISNNLKTDQILLRVWSKGFSHYLVVDESKQG